MTYNLNRLSNCSWVEYTRSSTQTISDGSIITFDTKRTTGGDAISLNSSTGVLSLSSSRRYWVQASIAVERSSNGDFKFVWEQSDGTALSESDGNFPAFNKFVASLTSKPVNNHSYIASLMVDSPTIQYRLKAETVPTNSTLLSFTHLFIIELE